MKLEIANLEEYQLLSDEQLRMEMVKVQMELKQTADDRENDNQLQAAIALADSLKMKYSIRTQQLKKLQKSLQLLATMRRL
jgi:hypothetical protein